MFVLQNIREITSVPFSGSFVWSPYSYLVVYLLWRIIKIKIQIQYSKTLATRWGLEGSNIATF